MNRLLPKSLFGQTLLVLVAGLIVSLLVGAWIYTLDREQAVRAVGGFGAAQRITNLTKLVQDAPREWRERIVAGLSDQTFRVSLSAQPPTFIPNDDDATVAQAIKEFLIDQLSLTPSQQPRVSASSPNGPVFGGPGADDGTRSHDARLRRFRRFRWLPRFAGCGPPARWPMAFVHDRPARKRFDFFAPVPIFDGHYGGRHSRSVGMGGPPRDGATCRGCRQRPNGSAMT